MGRAGTYRSCVSMGRGMGRGGIFSQYHESWRKHPMLCAATSATTTAHASAPTPLPFPLSFCRMGCFDWKLMLPGIREAVAIFTTYCALEWVYLKVAGPPK